MPVCFSKAARALLSFCYLRLFLKPVCLGERGSEGLAWCLQTWSSTNILPQIVTLASSPRGRKWDIRVLVTASGPVFRNDEEQRLPGFPAELEFGIFVLLEVLTPYLNRSELYVLFWWRMQNVWSLKLTEMFWRWSFSPLQHCHAIWEMDWEMMSEGRSALCSEQTQNSPLWAAIK